jgi:hypothetical protein
MSRADRKPPTRYKLRGRDVGRKRKKSFCKDFMLGTQKSILNTKVYQYKLCLGFTVPLIFSI